MKKKREGKGGLGFSLSSRSIHARQLSAGRPSQRLHLTHRERGLSTPEWEQGCMSPAITFNNNKAQKEAGGAAPAKEKDFSKFE